MTRSKSARCPSRTRFVRWVLFVGFLWTAMLARGPVAHASQTGDAPRLTVEGDIGTFHVPLLSEHYVFVKCPEQPRAVDILRTRSAR